MSVMIEIYCPLPGDPIQERHLAEQVSVLGGRIEFREKRMILSVSNHICLTCDFDDWLQAEHAAEIFRQQGLHVEGPCDYGDNATKPSKDDAT